MSNPKHDDEFSIPTDLSDILTVCQEFSKTGWNIQNQITIIIELGIKEAIDKGYVKRENLPLVRSYFSVICNNPYFGDAAFQAQEIIDQIDKVSKNLQQNLFN